MSLGTQASLIEHRARGLAKPLHGWIQRVARSEGRLMKVDYGEQLRRMLTRYGVAVIDESGQRAGGRAISRGTLVEDVIRGREIMIGWLDDWAQAVEESSKQVLRETESEVRRIIRATLLEAEQRSDRALTNVETSRLINRAIATHGNLGFERALRIARTETAIAANTGQVMAYDELGITEIEWLAYQSPIWPRRHDKMNGKRVDIGDYFTLPSGARCLHPGDPSLPVGELVNCRCSTAPVKKRRPK